MDKICLSVDFWECAGSHIDLVRSYVDNLLAKVEGSADKIDDFKKKMEEIVSKTGEFRVQIQTAADAHDVTLEHVSEEFGIAFDAVLEHLKVTFPSPDKAPSHPERQVMVSTALELVEQHVVGICGKYAIPESDVRAYFKSINPIIEGLIVTAGTYMFHDLTVFY